jgi:hypothetical protein
MYIYIYTHTHIQNIHTHPHTYKTCIHTHTYRNTRTVFKTRLFTLQQSSYSYTNGACIHAYMHTYTYTHTHTGSARTYMHTYIHIYAHTYRKCKNCPETRLFGYNNPCYSYTMGACIHAYIHTHIHTGSARTALKPDFLATTIHVTARRPGAIIMRN